MTRAGRGVRRASAARRGRRGGVALALVIAGFNLFLVARPRPRRRRDLVAPRAAGELAHCGLDGRSCIAELPDVGALDSPVWVFSGGRDARAAAPRVAPRPRRAALAAGRERSRRRAGQRHAPLRRSGRRRRQAGRHGRRRRLARALRATQRIALIGSLVLGAVLVLAVALVAALDARGVPAPGRADDRQAAAWSERDLDRRFAARRAATTSSTDSRRRSTACSIAWPRASAASGASRPRCPTSCAPRSRT